MRWSQGAGAWAALLLGATLAAAQAKPPPAPAPKAGKNVFGKSYYLLNLPSAYAPQRKFGLIVMLHGSGGRPENYAGVFGAAPNKDYFVCLPASNNPIGYNTKEDGDQIVGMIEEVLKNFSIDRDRIFISGHSAGGFMTCALAGQHPELFTAAAPVSGCLLDGTEKKLLHIPFYVISGKQDFNHAQAAQSVEKMKQAGMDVKFDDPDGWGHNPGPEAFSRVFAWFDGLCPPDQLATLQGARAHLAAERFGKAAQAAKKLSAQKSGFAKKRAEAMLAEIEAAAQKAIEAANAAEDAKKGAALWAKAKTAFEGSEQAEKIKSAAEESRKKSEAPK
jgi:predicted esterase